jgi:PAS domain S-box-containing protein
MKWNNAEEAASRLAAIVNSSDDAIVSKTLDGIVQSWNRGAELIFGYTAAEAVGQHIKLIIPEDRWAEEEHVLASLRRGEKIDHFETVRRAKDGRLIDISLTVSPVRDSQGRIIGASKIARDITARKRAVEALRESEDRSRQMAEKLEQLNTVLETRVAERTGDLLRSMAEREELQEQLLQAQKMESIGTLASGVAHDFNNLLNIILSHASVIRSNLGNPTNVNENLGIIEETVARGTGVVQQLMVFGRKDGKFESVALNAIVQKICNLIKEIFPRGIVTTLDVDHSVGTIQSNETQLHQVLLNLCLNARDAMPTGGEISIRTDSISGEKLRPRMPDAKAERYAVIHVADTGTGMDDATRRRIFEPFFTTKDSGQGSGLGLAVVYGIVQNHGGFIEVTSQLGQGTTFTIYLPATAEQSSSGESSQT